MVFSVAPIPGLTKPFLPARYLLATHACIFVWRPWLVRESDASEPSIRVSLTALVFPLCSWKVCNIAVDHPTTRV
jgi:hypothetical protein